MACMKRPSYVKLAGCKVAHKGRPPAEASNNLLRCLPSALPFFLKAFCARAAPTCEVVRQTEEDVDKVRIDARRARAAAGALAVRIPADLGFRSPSAGGAPGKNAPLRCQLRPVPADSLSQNANGRCSHAVARGVAYGKNAVSSAASWPPQSTCSQSQPPGKSG